MVNPENPADIPPDYILPDDFLTVLDSNFKRVGNDNGTGYEIGGTQLATLGGDPLPLAAAVRLIVKTATVFEGDAQAVVQYAVSDAFGRTVVSNAGASVAFSLGAYSGGCSLFTPGSPTGVCTAALPANAFSATADVALQGTVTVLYGGAPVASASATVTLAKVASRPAPADPGVYVVLPQYEAAPGDVVTLTFWAQTGSGATQLTSWALQVQYSGSVTFVPDSVSAPLYARPVVNAAGDGSVSVATSGLSAGAAADPSQVSGFFQLMTISFVVAAGDPPVFTVTVTSMVNQNTQNIPGAAGPASIGDLGDGWAPTGEIVVEVPTVVGLYAVSSVASLFNTAVMDGAAVGDSMSVYAVFGCGLVCRCATYAVLACNRLAPGSADYFRVSRR